MSIDVNELLRQMARSNPYQGLGAEPAPTPRPGPILGPQEGGRSGWDKPIPAYGEAPAAPAKPLPTYDIQGPPEAPELDERLIDQQFRRPVMDAEYGQIDPRFIGEVNRNPDGADAGPMFMSPMASDWYAENVFGRGFMVDWGANIAFNSETGEEFPLPRYFENSQ